MVLPQHLFLWVCAFCVVVGCFFQEMPCYVLIAVLVSCQNFRMNVLGNKIQSLKMEMHWEIDSLVEDRNTVTWRTVGLKTETQWHCLENSWAGDSDGEESWVKDGNTMTLFGEQLGWRHRHSDGGESWVEDRNTSWRQKHKLKTETQWRWKIVVLKTETGWQWRTVGLKTETQWQCLENSWVEDRNTVTVFGEQLDHLSLFRIYILSVQKGMQSRFCSQNVLLAESYYFQENQSRSLSDAQTASVCIFRCGQN